MIVASDTGGPPAGLGSCGGDGGRDGGGVDGGRDGGGGGGGGGDCEDAMTIVAHMASGRSAMHDSRRRGIARGRWWELVRHCGRWALAYSFGYFLSSYFTFVTFLCITGFKI